MKPENGNIWLCADFTNCELIAESRFPIISVRENLRNQLFTKQKALEKQKVLKSKVNL